MLKIFHLFEPSPRTCYLTDLSPASLTRPDTPDDPDPHSVGLVTPQTALFDTPLTLASGATLEHYQLVFETYGELNADASNAILICHALSGHHHVAGPPSPGR